MKAYIFVALMIGLLAACSAPQDFERLSVFTSIDSFRKANVPGEHTEQRIGWTVNTPHGTFCLEPELHSYNKTRDLMKQAHQDQTSAIIHYHVEARVSPERCTEARNVNVIDAIELATGGR